MGKKILLTLLVVALSARAAFADSGRAAGDFLIVFKPNDMILAFGKDVPDSVLNSVLELQSEYLKHRYDVKIIRAYPEITRGNGMGMFHIHSKKAAMSDALFDDVMRELKGDPNIESVSENRAKKIMR